VIFTVLVGGCTEHWIGGKGNGRGRGDIPNSVAPLGFKLWHEERRVVHHANVVGKPLVHVREGVHFDKKRNCVDPLWTGRAVLMTMVVGVGSRESGVVAWSVGIGSRDGRWTWGGNVVK